MGTDDKGATTTETPQGAANPWEQPENTFGLTIQAQTGTPQADSQRHTK
jgi:hypothetical protein